ncbi:BZ3500_MvSof-1268-A1-R1_Chr6-3g08936 [Microbotryum saponariae]|uniref:BZ3500_MvSof-1268-A1-R1_Chr6-3g08936 protein n=1 Tax=Microbotryum saponariae TaxID=289078 RepID=A0A2X0LQ43_9BASI|nr:BZ3500_MvSof-1268-A1-R1_Chr6-3g08936 [Microbotryum saponariae]SDA07538.1 BZ3501_MvSof-1269-A2-R1_Chr6-2g08640 [Microbotryum saponariae]
MDIPPHTTPHLPSSESHTIVGSPPLIPVAPVRPPKPAHLSSVRNLAQVGGVRHRATNSELDVVRSEAAGQKGQLLVDEFALGAAGARTAYPQMPRWSLSSDTWSSRSGTVSEVTENEVCASNLGKEVQSKVDELSLGMMGCFKSGTKLDRSKASPTIFSKREIEAPTLRRSASSSSSPPASRSSDFSTLRPLIPTSQYPYFNNLPSSPSSPSPSHPSAPPLQKALTHHPFQGHSEFNELSFSKGEILFIELEDLGGGWSLGFRELEGVEGRGLVPRGWYAFVEGGEGEERVEGVMETVGSRGLDGFGEVISEGAEDEERSTRTEIGGRHEQGLKKDSDTPTVATCESNDHLVDAHEVLAILQPSNGLDPEAAWSEMIAQAERNAEEGMDGLREEAEQSSYETPVDNLGASDRPLLDSHQPEEPPGIDLSSPKLSLSLEPEPEPGLLVVSELVSEPSPLTPSPLVPKTRADAQIFDWILYGEEATTKEIDDAEEVQLFHIESGPAWKDPLPDLSIRVHDPEIFHPPRGSAYTLYSITTNFHSDPNSADENPLPPPITITRRFSHFVHLHTLLCSSYPILVIPDLPSRAYARRFERGFVESRCRDLQRWIRRVVRHPVLKGTNELRDFLMLENEEGVRFLRFESVRRSTPETDGDSLAVLPGPSFFSRVYHPEYNIDIDEARETIERFELHAKAVELGNGVKEVEVGLGNYREAVFDAAQIISSLGRSLVRLVAGRAIPPLSQDPSSFRALQGMSTSSNERAKQWCVQTEQGAFSWKESTESESLSMTKAVQATGETLMTVGEVWEGSAQDSLLKQQEMLKELDRPHTQYLPLVETHRLVLLEHERLSRLIDQSTKESDRYQECLSRCETILNITCAELERVHVESREDLKELARGILEGQIRGCEEALHHLRFAQAHFDPPQAYAALALTGPRLVSKLEESSAPSVSGPELRRELKQPSSYTGLPSGASSAQGGRVLTRPIGMVAGAVASVTTRSRNPTPMGLQRSNTAGTAYRRARYDDHVAASSSKTWTQSLFMGTIGRG